MQLVDLENKIMMLEEEKAQALEESENFKKDVNSMKDELKKKVNQLTQVNNMKKMMADKNEQLKKLSERLSKYEKDEDD